MQKYIKLLRKFGIAYKSITLSFDEATQTKKSIHPPGWQHTTVATSSFDYLKNAIIQITGPNSNITVIDTDGPNHKTNKMINEICQKHCKFYNKTRKGYHFFFQFNADFAKCQSIKYINDPENSGLDIKSTNGCVYYGSYKIGNDLIKYENILAEAIVPMPAELIKELKALFTKSATPVSSQRKTAKYPSLITNTTGGFPECTIVDIATLDKLISCYPSKYFETYDKWIEMCFLIKQTNHTESAFQLFYKYSKLIAKYANVSEAECRAKWDSIKYEPNFVFQEMLFIARRHNKKLFNTITLPWMNSQHLAFNPVVFNSRYIDYNFVKPYFEKNKIVSILSPYGTGKTHFMSNLFTNITNTQPETSILFITPRVSLSYSHQKSFPQFNHYQQIKPNQLKKSTKLILQLDSLYKLEQQIEEEDPFTENRSYINLYLPPAPVAEDIPVEPAKMPTYDIIALDEIESLLYHLSFEKLDSQRIFNILRKLCMGAKKIIAMDGDYSNRAHYFLSTLAEDGTPPVVLQNEYKTTSKHFIFTNDQLRFNKQIADDLKSGLKIVIICLTLENSEYYRQLYRDKYKVIIHNSIQNDKTGLTNVNEYWKCDLLIYTSTIESGCDHNAKWFNKCFIVLSDKGTTPRALMQMCNRVREYAHHEVMAYTNNVPFYEFQMPYQFDEVKRTAFRQMMNSQGQLSILDTILCYNETETLNKEYFITVLTQLIIAKGHTYEYQRLDKASHTKMKSDIQQEIANADNIITEEDYLYFLKELRKTTISAKDMRTYYCMIKKYIVSKVWGLDIKAIDKDDIKTYLPKITKLHNYKYFITFLGNQNKTSFKNVKLEKKITYVKDILWHFGIRHEADFDFSIECGIGKEGRIRNKKENPNIITSTAYETIKTELMTVIKDEDFRFAFGLEKLTKEISNRQYLETIKKVIGEFGFTLNVVQKNTTTTTGNIRSTIHNNTYFIDLDTTILEYINLRTRDYITDILDEVSSGFIQSTDDEEFNIYLTDNFDDEEDNFNLFEED